MSPWWSKSTSKEANKKVNGDGIFGLIQRKLKSLSESIHIASRRRSKIDSKTIFKSQASSPSTPVARYQNVAHETHAYPLPPSTPVAGSQNDVEKRALRNAGSSKCSSPLFLFPLPEPSIAQNRHDQSGIEGHWELDSVFTYSDTDDPSDSRLLRPQTSSDTRNKTSAISPSNREMQTSPKRHPLSFHTVNLQNNSVTPLHFGAGESNMYSFTNKPTSARNEKQQAHRLPLPPLTISNSGPCSPSHFSKTIKAVFKSPGRTDLLTSQASCWKKGRILGRGTFGHVYLAFNSERGGVICVMKEVNLFSDDAKLKENARQLKREIAILSSLRHPNIVQYYESEIVDDKLYMYLEYVSGGSVHNLLQEYGRLGEHLIKRYTRQILLGLDYLHGNGMVHRDIKGANILVELNGCAKLANFGMAEHIINNNSNGCNPVVDIWSLGCTIVEMATTKPPWSQYEELHLGLQRAKNVLQSLIISPTLLKILSCNACNGTRHGALVLRNFLNILLLTMSVV